MIALGIACAAVVVVVLVNLWSTADQNVAGWVTTAVVDGAAFVLWAALGLDEAFTRAPRRAQWVVAVLTLVLAAGASLIYVIFPGTATWYLVGIAAFPAGLVLLSFRSRGGSGHSGDFGDGPWTAP